jgi:divalent metal cation (Fe/Co/Zn/Cd) transporter
MDLSGAHAVATRLEQTILRNNSQVQRVTMHLEAPDTIVVHRQEVTQQYPEMAAQIRSIADTIAGAGRAHDVHLYRSYSPNTERKALVEDGSEGLDILLHAIFDAHAPISQVHTLAEEIQRTLRQAFPHLASVVIHTEPPEQ